MAGPLEGDDDDGINAINVTPMVNIMLVLLVIFMVTTATINKLEGMQVDKPDAKTGKTLEDVPKSVLLVCHADGRVLVDGDELADDAAITAAIRAKLESNVELQGIVQCDQTAQVGAMVRLIDLLRDSGVKKYAVVTEQPKPAKE